MSNIYVHEPPTNGTVKLVTTVGDINIDLWSKEAPKACKNFVQLCLDGYYNNTIFHRLIRGFIIQGGDPKGDGDSHGESIYGKPYMDEFHSRLRYVRRGLVGMANSGPNDNTSHFFFTLAATPELNKKNTIFAKIGGETIYNMLKLADGETDKNDKPLHPHKIISTKVLDNPFPELVCRIKDVKIKENSETDLARVFPKEKNFNLLSFGDEAEQEEIETTKINYNEKFKIKSSHDILNDEKLSSTPAVDLNAKRKMVNDDDESNHSSDYYSDDNKKMKDPEAAKRVRDKIKRKFEEEKFENIKKKKLVISKESLAKCDELDTINDDIVIPTTKDKIKELRKEANLIRKELKKEKVIEPVKEINQKEVIQSAAIQELEAISNKYKDIKGAKKKSANRETMTLQLLQKFQNKLQSQGQVNTFDDMGKDDKNNKEDDDLNDTSWLGHKLMFEDETTKSKVKDANVADAERYELFDPRNSMNKRRRKDDKKEKKHNKHK